MFCEEKQYRILVVHAQVNMNTNSQISLCVATGKMALSCYIYIYIYAFRRRFYPKQPTVHSGYTLFCQYVTSHNALHYMCI